MFDNGVHFRRRSCGTLHTIESVWKPGAVRCSARPACGTGATIESEIQIATQALYPDDFLHLADFLLDLPANLLALAFGFQLGIVRRSSNLFFNFTFHLVKRA